MERYGSLKKKTEINMSKPKTIKQIAREIEGIPKCPRSGETNLLHIITNKAKEHGDIRNGIKKDIHT